MEEEFEILSTKEALLGFEQTTIYKDYVKELDVRIDELTNALQDEGFSGRQYDVFRGGIKNMKQMKTVFQDLAYGKAGQSQLQNNEE
jgi:hypothetical protein